MNRSEWAWYEQMALLILIPFTHGSGWSLFTSLLSILPCCKPFPSSLRLPSSWYPSLRNPTRRSCGLHLFIRPPSLTSIVPCSPWPDLCPSHSPLLFSHPCSSHSQHCSLDPLFFFSPLWTPSMLLIQLFLPYLFAACQCYCLLLTLNFSFSMTAVFIYIYIYL